MQASHLRGEIHITARELRATPGIGLTAVAFIDDDIAKHGTVVEGVPVAGPIADLAAIQRSHAADELIIAMPSAPGTVVRQLHRLAQEAGLATFTVPTLFEILSGRVKVSAIRPVQIDDLLRRAPVTPDQGRVGVLLWDKTVLVTGAGGSIGAELCRQAAMMGPRRLVAVDHGENAIFEIDAELRARWPGLDVVSQIADIRDASRITRILAEQRPEVVIHAAAHKHVPLMERNVAEAVENNVLGTRVVAEAAAASGVECFVLVSSDKAVRPTNVMGATKRVAELVVQELAGRLNRRFISVRFGNVLASSGSVIPVFLKQIESGGPLKVTHPEMRRYFMTIAESAQLVLQAAALGAGGEVFVLDMGEPVRIVDLATDLIRLSGLEPGRDIEIEFTGVRPGEKLYEELFFGLEQAEPTGHAKVLRARHADLPADLRGAVDRLIAQAGREADEDNLRRALQELVPDYHPEQSAHNISGLGRSVRSTKA